MVLIEPSNERKEHVFDGPPIVVVPKLLICCALIELGEEVLKVTEANVPHKYMASYKSITKKIMQRAIRANGGGALRLWIGFLLDADLCTFAHARGVRPTNSKWRAS